MHDVEFVADEKLPRRGGNHVAALGEEREQYGLNENQEGETYTDKDHKILSAVKKLFELRDDRGVIKRVGISGECTIDLTLSNFSRQTYIRLPTSNPPATRDSHPEAPRETSGPRDVLLSPHSAE